MSSALKDAKLIDDAWHKSKDNLVKGVGRTVAERYDKDVHEFNDLYAYLNRPEPEDIYEGQVKFKNNEGSPDWNSTIEVHQTPKRFYDDDGDLLFWMNDKSVSLSSARMLR